MDADALGRLLTSSLLTDTELADGFEAWTTFTDPFAGCFPLGDETSTQPASADA
jgi:hypothetical protein